MFSIKNKLKEDLFYSSISSAKWKINGEEVIFKQGFNLEQSGQGNALMEIFRKETDISYKTCCFVDELYRSKFMVVDKGNYLLRSFLQTDALPDELKRKFPSHISKSIPKDILWVEVQLPQPVSPEIMNDLTISMNCFPVINRKFNEFSQLLNLGNNIIPLETDDLFFEIKNITDTKGTIYKPLNSFTSENISDEGYIIRQAGIARFDSRDAKETINHLIDLIRDEREGFSVLGTDMISSELKQLDQIISRLKQRLNSSNITDGSNSYIMLNSKSNFERVNVQFWSTNGNLANNIRSDSRLTIHHGPDLDNNNVFLVTNTFGGRQKLSKEDKLNKLRIALLSKGRIITVEDIKAHCFEQFGTELLRVEIKKGVHLDDSTKKGLVRSLDIFLTLSKKHSISDENLKQKINEMKIRLKQESINLLPFRVFIN
jgi:hypothetical protein